MGVALKTPRAIGRAPLRSGIGGIGSGQRAQAVSIGASSPAPRSAIGFGARAKFVSSPKFGAVAVGSFVPKLARKAFEKFGFSAATILTDWSTIAGAELAAFSAPERLKWPREVPSSDAGEDASHSRRGRPGATLILRVDGPRSIEVQYKAPQIIERINAYFGYRAVTELRIIQAPVSSGKALEPAPRTSAGARGQASPIAPPALRTDLYAACDIGRIEDAALRHALENLGRSVSAGRR